MFQTTMAVATQWSDTRTNDILVICRPGDNITLYKHNISIGIFLNDLHQSRYPKLRHLNNISRFLYSTLCLKNFKGFLFSSAILLVHYKSYFFHVSNTFKSFHTFNY